MTGKQEGQATVELALCLPFLLVFVLLFAQVGAVALQQVAVTAAAREAARAAAVEGLGEAPRRAAVAATALDPTRLRLVTRRSGSMVVAEVRYQTAVTMPVTSVVLLRPTLSAIVSMHSEAPG